MHGDHHRRLHRLSKSYALNIKICVWDTRNPSPAFTHSTSTVFTPDMAYHHWHSNGQGIAVTTDIPATRSLKPLNSPSKSQHSNWVSLGVERESHEGSIGGLRRQEFNGGTDDLGHRNRGSSSSHTHMRFTIPWTHLFEKSVLGCLSNSPPWLRRWRRHLHLAFL